MKNIKKYFGLTLIALLFTAVFSACNDEDEIGSANIGLGIKVFSPTKVVSGQPVTINGSGFGDVTEVVFPGGIAVKDFELVSNEMIRVITPQGINIAPEGENLILRSADEEVVSPRVMTQGNTVPTSYSAQEGDEVSSNSILKIFGKDMEFVNKVTFTGKEDQPLVILAKDFYRIATGSISIKIPSDIKEGLQIGTFETYDGKLFSLPEFKFKAAEGYWKVTRKYLWQNDGTTGAVNWNGTYRFGLDGNDGNNECIKTFSIDDWDIIKNGEFYFLFDGGDNANVRITTGWWISAYGGDEHNSLDFANVDEESGMKVIHMNIKEDGHLYDNLDAQHLLFTGSDYTPMAMFIEESEWVEGSAGHWERQSFWKNDGSAGEISWNGTYRFGLEGNDGNNECIKTFDAETWEFLKTSEFLVDIAGPSPQIRVTTGWWSTTWTGDDIIAGNDRLVDNGDGTMTLTVNLAGDPILDLLDAQHLLFTGSGYTVLEIYTNVWVGGSATLAPVVAWENDGTGGEISWNGTYRFGLDGKDGSNECIKTFDAETWEVIKTKPFFVELEGANPQIRVTTGWWSTTWTGVDIQPGNELLVDNGDGSWTLSVNLSGDPILDLLDDQHLLFTGSGYTPMKIYYYK